MTVLTESASYLYGLVRVFSLVGLFISNFRNSRRPTLSLRWSHERLPEASINPQVLLLRSYVLSSVVACQAPKSHPLICHKEEHLWGRAGLAFTQKDMKGACMGFPMGVIVANRSDPLLVFKCVCLLSGTVCSPLRLL